MNRRKKIGLVVLALAAVVVLLFAQSSFSAYRSSSQMNDTTSFMSSWGSSKGATLSSPASFAIVAEPAPGGRGALAARTAKAIGMRILHDYSPVTSTPDARRAATAIIYPDRKSAEKSKADCTIIVSCESFRYPIGGVLYRTWHGRMKVTGKGRQQEHDEMIHLSWESDYQPAGNMLGVLPSAKLREKLASDIAESTVKALNEKNNHALEDFRKDMLKYEPTD